MKEWMIWYPTDFILHHQWKFHNTKAKIKILVGGWASGKTLTCTIEFLSELTQQGNFGFMGRYELPELMQSVFEDILYKYLPDKFFKQNANKRIVRFPKYNSSFVYSFLNPSKLKNKLMGGNFGVIFIDQMEEIPEDIFETLYSSRLRREGFSRVFLANSNPNGKDWIWVRFVKNAEKRIIKPSKAYFEELIKRNLFLGQLFSYETFPPYYEYYNPDLDSYTWVVPSFHNPFVPEDVLRGFTKLPPDVYKRYVLASFDEFSGKIYTEFDPDKHIYTADREYMNMDVFVAIDPAVKGYTAVVFSAWDRETKRLYVFDEVYIEDAYPAQVIDKIHQKLQIYELELNKITFIIDVASKKQYFNKDRSLYQFYADLMPIPKSAPKDRLIMNVKMFFHNNMIKINARCENTIREHTNYKWKQHTLKDEPLKVDDHTVDCLQYIVDEIILHFNLDFNNLTLEEPKETEYDFEEEFHRRMQEHKKQVRELMMKEGLKIKRINSWRV
jgi:PBSX family phage terminase large subunit